jgi:hypothetical protein
MRVPALIVRGIWPNGNHLSVIAPLRLFLAGVSHIS